MRNKQYIEITLPEELADLPIQIVRGTDCNKLIIGVQDTEDDANGITYADNTEKKDIFIWRKNDYLKVTMDEILWIEADSGYSTVHLTEERSLTISTNLAVIMRILPAEDFIRIHRSYIVSRRNLKYLVGNSVKVGDALLTIGREYREPFLDRFLFLSVRRKKE